MQMINQFLIYSYLIICTYTDFKKRVIYPLISMIFSFLGFILNYIIFAQSFSHLYTNIFFIIFLILIYFLSRKQLGLGDIIMFFSLCFFINSSEYLTLFFYSFFSASIFAIFYLVFRKKNRLYRIPLAPFILFGKLFSDLFIF